MSSDFDDFIIVSSSNKKVAASVKKALLKKIEEEDRTCENATKWRDLPHDRVKPRPFPYGWNGAENAYEESVDLCDDCFEQTS